MTVCSPSASTLPSFDRSTVSLRSRILFILLLAAVPGMVVAVFLTIQQLREETRQIERSVTQLAAIGAAEHQSVIASARVLLKSVAESQQLDTIKDADCQTYLEGWSDQFGYFTSLTLFDTSGRLVCTNVNGELPFSAGEQSWFTEARSKATFVLSDYQIGRNGTPLLVAAVPVESRTESVIGIAALGISLDWLNFLAATVNLPDEATITVLGPDGNILSHHDGQSTGAERSETQPSDATRLQIHNIGSGTLRADDKSGVTRVYGFGPTKLGGVTVIVGLPQFVEYFNWSNALAETLISPIVVLLLALGAAAWASEALVVRHVRSLISTAGEIASGNLKARSDVDYEEHELGQLAEALDTMAEEIEQKQAELKDRSEDNLVIAQEMQHRIANTLTLVRIIATQSLKKSRSQEDFIEAFSQRLQALSVSNERLLQGDWKSAELEGLVLDTLKLQLDQPHRRVDLSGPPVELGPRSVLAITLSIHELCTNSIKYGALSRPNGRIALRWHIEDRAQERWLSIRWQEMGGPIAVMPNREGFGSRLMKSMVEGNLQGRLDRIFAREGLTCVIAFPVANTV